MKDKLTTLLIEQTQILKEQYILKTKEYAAKKFAWCEARKGWSYQQWVEQYTATTNYGGKNLTTLSKEGHTVRDTVSNILSLGFELFEGKEVRFAEMHYIQSIERLANRLVKKNISEDFEMKTTTLHQNIETIITGSNGQVVKAWTIIAEGPIQRPHYRYLVK